MIQDPNIFVHRHSFGNPWTYQDLDSKQREIAASEQGALIFSEVSPVITLGKRTRSIPKMSQLSTDIFKTDRGGLETYHGPGQWMLFPVFSKEELGVSGIKDLVSDLLKIAHFAAEELGVESAIRGGNELGLWTEKGKLASVGLRVRNRVLHGLSLNVYPTPESFRGINPCGLNAGPAYLYGEDLTSDILKQETLMELSLASMIHGVQKIWPQLNIDTSR